MTKATDKKLFTVLGTIQLFEGRKRFVPYSRDHLQARISTIAVGKEVSCTFSTKIPTRSRTQLNYHFVLMEYIADFTGYTREQVHDLVVAEKFGTEKISIGGITREVRKSISDGALFPKSDMVELITYDLELCANLGIRVPTPQELGYVKN